MRPTRVDVRRTRCESPGSVGFILFVDLAGRNDRHCAPSGDGVVALAGVEGTDGGNAADLLFGRDLVEQFGQHGGVTDVAGGELGRPDFQ